MKINLLRWLRQGGVSILALCCIVMCVFVMAYNFRAIIYYINQPTYTMKEVGVASNKSGGNCSNQSGVVVKRFKDLPDDKKEDVIVGTLFLICIWGIIAYFCILWDKASDPTRSLGAVQLAAEFNI